MNGLVDGSVQFRAVVWDVWSGVDGELVNNVFLLFEINFVKVGEEVAGLCRFELGSVLAVSSWKDL